MKEKMVEVLKEMAVKTAQKSVGKSFPIGLCEIEVPKELLNREDYEKR